MKRILICLALTALTLTAACRATPETEYIVNRGDGDPETLLMQQPAGGSASIREAVLQLPEGSTHESSMLAGHYRSEDAAAGTVPIVFDAEVIVPDADRFPVCAIEPCEWSAEERIAILKAAAGDAPIYAPGMYPHVSKSYYEQVLREMKDSERVQTVDRIYFEDPDSDVTWTETVQEYYRTAPEQIELTPFDEHSALGKGETDAFYWREGMETYVDFSASGNQITLGVFDRVIHDENRVRQGEWLGATPGRELVNPSLTEEEAKEKAAAFLNRIGFQGTCAESETLKAQRTHLFTFSAESEGYLLTYRTSVNGIPMIAPDYPEANADGSDYAMPLRTERVRLYADADGIWSVQWLKPTCVTEVLNESAALMDFDAILRILTARLRAENAYSEQRQIERVTVNRLRLGCGAVPKKDAHGEGYAIPVWIMDYTVQTADGWSASYSVSINAIDGSNLHLPQELIYG